jgi:hypothetical protein
MEEKTILRDGHLPLPQKYSTLTIEPAGFGSKS